jgi:hypothetical protein
LRRTGIFGDHRPPPEIKFGIGDVVSVSIFEAAGGIVVGAVSLFAGGGAACVALSVIARWVDRRDDKTFRPYGRAKWSSS